MQIQALSSLEEIEVIQSILEVDILTKRVFLLEIQF